MLISNLILIVIISLSIRLSETLECYSCSNVDRLENCNVTTHCNSGQTCFVELSNNEYTLGCTAVTQCGALSSVAVPVLGRRNMDIQSVAEIVERAQPEETILSDPLVKQLLNKREAEHCFECCSTDICNSQLCRHLRPTACIDDAKVDCAWMNSKFNICQIIHQAKVVCPKFCGLCSLVDGSWGSWGTWSACDVTCANGTQTRARSCINPTPVHGGLDCPGIGTETRTCSHPPCPVTPTVVFRSHNLQSTSMGSDMVLVFTITDFNAGGGYDNQTGKFSAPYPGTYSFSAQFCFTSTNYYLYYTIVHNNVDIKSGRFGGNGYNYQCHRADTIAVLAEHDMVWIRSTSSSSGTLYQDSYMWNSFSGFLVHI